MSTAKWQNIAGSKKAPSYMSIAKSQNIAGSKKIFIVRK